MRIAFAMAGALLLSGCATDGRLPGADPVLNQQFEMDRTVCQGELQKANLSGVTFAGGGFPTSTQKPILFSTL
jgi:hypothetical protein